jgi:hypothetical protein
MSGAAWNPKKKTPEEEWDELVIMKNEYYDILTTEECLIPTLEEYRKQRWEEVKDTPQEPNGMVSCWGFNIRIEKDYKKKYGDDNAV